MRRCATPGGRRPRDAAERRSKPAREVQDTDHQALAARLPVHVRRDRVRDAAAKRTAAVEEAVEYEPSVSAEVIGEEAIQLLGLRAQRALVTVADLTPHTRSELGPPRVVKPDGVGVVLAVAKL